MVKSIDLDKHIWEGWTVGDFIEELELIVDMIMDNRSIIEPFVDRNELKKWCMDNQPYYKKYIPELVDHFANKYNIS